MSKLGRVKLNPLRAGSLCYSRPSVALNDLVAVIDPLQNLVVVVLIIVVVPFP